MLTQPHFRASSRACENDVVAAADRFVSLLATTSAHGFATGRKEPRRGGRAAGERIAAHRGWLNKAGGFVLPQLGRNDCPIEQTSKPGHGIARQNCGRGTGAARCQSRRRRRHAAKAASSRTNSVSRSGKGESEQTRAEQRQTRCRQSQEAVGDKVMIAHDSPSESMLARID